MRFIRRAFEMKANGDSLEKIAKYLHLHGVKTAKGDLTETLFQNTVYI